MFMIHLITLKHQLSLYNDKHKWFHLFIKLKSELRIIIINVQMISTTWNALIDLVFKLKINLQKQHALSLKWHWNDDFHDQNKISKKFHLKQKKSHQSVKIDLLSKSSIGKNLSEITYYICSQKNYYINECIDEKAKKMKSDVNQVFVDLMIT